MTKSLRTKLIFIMLLLILLLMTVVCVFLVRGVGRFYTEDFFQQMQTVFADEEMAGALRDAAPGEGGADRLYEVLSAYSGKLGIDAGNRNCYILDAEDGSVLTGSDDAETLEITPNLLTAMTGSEGCESDPSADCMDVAIPIEADGGGYIIYIKDRKQTVQALSRELFSLILEAVAIGFVITAALSILLSRTLLRPILDMTAAAGEMAGGDFSRKIEVQSDDEVGTLAMTFNDMASRLETTLNEIKKSEALRREFVANVSHELRTPITSIRSYAETLTDSDGLPKDTEEEFLRVIMNESDRMTKIVQDLLELSRFDSGRGSFTFEKFSLERSVREVYAAVALDARKRGHTVNLELEWKLPEIVGDRSRIEQVLMNILTNAMKYTPDGGMIDIYSGRDGERVWVKVHDTGIGIPESDLPRVFDRFYRVDKARSRASGGTGLGLSIASEIIERHGGEITMESTVGEGTAVTVYLPISGPKPVSEEPRDE